MSFALGGNLLIDIFYEQSLLFKLKSKDISLSQVRIDVKKKVLTELDASRVFGNIFEFCYQKIV